MNPADSLSPQDNPFFDSGVFFVATLREMALEAEAPHRIKDDWATIRRWLIAGHAPLSTEQQERLRKGWAAYLAVGLAPSEKLQPTFDLMSAAALAADPCCKEHTPPIEVMDAFDRLLASDHEIALKRSKDIAVEQKRIRAAMSNINASLPARAAPSEGTWRKKSPEFRKWVFSSVVWCSFVVLYTAVFDPFERGALSYWSESDVFRVAVVALLPTFAWGLKVVFDRYVK